ncbi:hypothetical protein BDY24DRAFT_9300 [Mrakia frigida]|uniref:uncharacterized protein n=1 Tax=Mrakia frigida TaxID=29902 RepID=UPI003FCC1549
MEDFLTTLVHPAFLSRPCPVSSVEICWLATRLRLSTCRDPLAELNLSEGPLEESFPSFNSFECLLLPSHRVTLPSSLFRLLHLASSPVTISLSPSVPPFDSPLKAGTFRSFSSDSTSAAHLLSPSLSLPSSSSQKMSLQLRSVLPSLSLRPSHLALLPRVAPQALFLSHRGFKTSQQLHWSSSTPPFSSDPITSRTIEKKQEPSEQRDAQEEVEREEAEQYGPGDMMMLEEWRVQKGSMGGGSSGG